MNRILIIEDDATIRELIRESLTNRDFEVIVAESGQSGVDKVQEYLPDVIVCDIVMPGLNGYDVFKTLRQNTMTAMIPFIFLTGVNDEEEKKYAIELGVDGYLNKPCKIEKLVEAIALVLNSKL